MPAGGGTKVNDPHAYAQENPGPITTDSLAAESTRAGSAFSRNPNSQPQGVAGSNSTFTTTNTSGATRLDPASDAEARMAQSDWAEEKMLSAGGVYPDALGSGHGKGFNTGSMQSTGGGAEGHRRRSGSRPKGANLKEGGFESDDTKNVSFNSEIGSENDPGLAAERSFEMANATREKTFPRQKGLTGDAHYQGLESETSA